MKPKADFSSPLDSVQEEPPHPGPRVTWDLGTAYDLFISLHVLHNAERFGLRLSWAAGVRQRLAAEERKTLEEADLILHGQLPWVHGLAQPKDAATVLYTLRQIPPAERLEAIGMPPEIDVQARAMLRTVSQRKAWNESDREMLREQLINEHKDNLRPRDLGMILNAWADAAVTGERYLQALQAYYNNFFSEEEEHLRPVLEAALHDAQALSETLALTELVERLSQGLHIQGLDELEEVVLAPSFWGTPLVFMPNLGPRRQMLIFGARPADASLIPGEIVPDALLQALKALADPTRLRILRYLSQGSLTPAELARRLRLRPPTVIYHINALRVAGLVQILLDKKEDRGYAVRMEMVHGLGGMLEEFLHGGGEIPGDPWKGEDFIDPLPGSDLGD